MSELVGIGHAILDITAYHSDAFLQEHHLPKGSMALVDEKRINELYDLMGAATTCPGGSAANTLAGFAMLGGSAQLIGKVSDDSIGHVYTQDTEKVGVTITLS